MDQGRPPSRATVLNGPVHHVERLKRVGTVASLQVEVREILDQPRNIAARGLYFNRDTDRVAVILK